MKPKSFIRHILLLTIFLSSCSLFEPERETNEIQIDQEKLGEAEERIRTIFGIKSLIVSIENTFYIEEYYNGHTQNTPHDIRSVTKSFLSTLVGIAIDKGYIDDVHITINSYLNNLVEDSPDDIGNITLHQLLTMSCGLAWSEIPGPTEFPAFVNAPDQLLYIINKQFVSTPGTEFNYSDGASHLVSIILSEATEMSTMEFANQHLFQYLNITPAQWIIDNRGYYIGGAGLKITSRDMVELGRLYLQNGKYITCSRIIII